VAVEVVLEQIVQTWWWGKRKEGGAYVLATPAREWIVSGSAGEHVSKRSACGADSPHSTVGRRM